jgi:hypothetical protein
MRLSTGFWMSLVCSLAALACGRVPLDLPATGSGGVTGGATGSAGTSGAAGTGGAAGSGTGSGGFAGSAPVRVPAVHRPTAAPCVFMTPPTSPSPCEMTGTGPCKGNGDCTFGTDGRCVLSLPAGACSCTYDACFADADCPFGDVCSCSGAYSGNACVSGSCRTDADCGASGYCSPVVEGCSMQVVGYACHTAKDTCSGNSDCPFSASCAPEFSDGAWVCGPANGCPM